MVIHGFVVKNKYMKTIVDYYKTEGHVNTEKIGRNNIEEVDALKALFFLNSKCVVEKLKMQNRQIKTKGDFLNEIQQKYSSN